MDRTIQIDGKPVVGKYLGKGLFSKAYRVGDTVYLLCKGDFSKECIALFVDKSLAHIPQIERHGDFQQYQVFSMPFYQKVTKKHTPKAFQQWSKLPNSLSGMDQILALIEELRKGKEESLAQAIEELSSQFCNYADPSDVLMEFQKFNVSADQQGNLILRDCLADSESIDRAWEEKGKRQRQHQYN